MRTLAAVVVRPRAHPRHFRKPPERCTGALPEAFWRACFEAALQRVRERVRLMEAAGLAARLTALREAEHAEREKCGVERLVVPIATGEMVVPVVEIDWIGADDYYACVHVGAKSHLLRESLASLESRLDPRRFARVHRSAIVRIDRIRELHGDEVELRDGMRLAVSRRRRAAIEGLLRGLRAPRT